MLEKDGVSLRVVNVSSIKPIDVEALRKYSSDVKAIVTAEEHSVIGGLGSAVLEALAPYGVKLGMGGMEDTYGRSAENYDVLMEYYHLTKEEIASRVKTMLEK